METLPLHLVRCDQNSGLIACATGFKTFLFDPSKDAIITVNDHKDVVRCIIFDSDGQHWASLGDDKQIFLLSAKDGTRLATKIHNKKILTATFANPDVLKIPTVSSIESAEKVEIVNTDLIRSVILFGDKFGDVYATSIPDMKDQHLILGHCSTITHLIMSPKEDAMVSADRDEKIRVSHYPNAFDIQEFCLGHTSMVTKVAIPTHNDTLMISGGGDGTLRLWKYQEGKLLHTVELFQQGENPKDFIVAAIEYSPVNNLFAVVVEGKPSIQFYKIAASLQQLEQLQTLSLDASTSLYDISFDKDGNLWIAGKNPFIQRAVFKDGNYQLAQADFAKLEREFSSVQVSSNDYRRVVDSLSLKQVQKKELIDKRAKHDK